MDDPNPQIAPPAPAAGAGTGGATGMVPAATVPPGPTMTPGGPLTSGNMPPATMAGSMAVPMGGSGVPPVKPGDVGSTAGTGGTGDVGTAGTGDTTEDPPPTTTGSCLDGITDYEKDGPFKFEAKTAGQVKMWVPMVPAGCKVPVIHLANGTGASCSSYMGALTRLASHGFLTTCYEDPNTGAGTQGIMAFDAALAMFPDLADHKLGSTGHSQGGQAAFTVLSLAEAKYGDSFIYSGLAMEPASGFGTQPAGGWTASYAKIKSPMFMFSGTADILVSEAWVSQAFSAMAKTTETYWYSAVGATHIPTPVPQEQQVSIPWFRWTLLGDQAACKFFKAMPDGPDWDKRMSQNETPCK